MKIKKIFSFLILFLFFNCLFAQNKQGNKDESLFNENNEFVYAKPDLNHWISSLLYISSMEITLSFYNMVIQQEDYSFINLDTMYNNLVNPWIWDNDEFYINQLYHPYQGSMYFIAGRANGLSFYQSLLTNLYGTLTWEYLMEIDTPAVNDLLLTEITGSYLGEILHKTYHVLEDQCLPIAVIISPIDALNRLLTGQRSLKFNSYVSNFYFCGGYSFLNANLYKSSNPYYNISEYDNTTYENLKAYNNTSNLFFELNYSYGNQFGHNSKEPLDAFNLNFKTIDRAGHFYYSILTDGILFSKSLNINVNTDSSLGFVYNFDYVMASDLNYNNNSLGLLFNLKKEFDSSLNNYISFGLSVNFAINGASEYYDLHSHYVKADRFGNKQRLYDIGFGPNLKYFFNYQNSIFGRFYFNGFTSLFITPEFTKPTDGSMGNNFITYLDIGYEHSVYNNLSFGINEIIYFKKGNYYQSDDVTHKLFFTNFYLKYQFN